MTQSIYQVDGQPLSEAAIYQQRLRQGIYKSPSIPSVGVNRNASDTAALLASSSDLTVRPAYERDIAPEAQTAALAAKREDVSNWSRDHVDANAEHAATSSIADSGKQAGASNIKNGLGVGTYDKKSVFSAATKNSSASIMSRSDPVKDSRHGLASQSAAASLNIAKISQVANKNSARSLDSRFNPQLDHRSGLVNHQKLEYLTQLEENLAASGAEASLKHGGLTTAAAATRLRSKSFKSTDLPYPNLLQAANGKAQERLKTLNSSSPADFKQKAQLYANALALAQKRSDDRIKQNVEGVINLGGGLTITRNEINKKASLIVDPVLVDIENKARNQRDIDEANLRKKKELHELHEKAKQEEIDRKNKLKQDYEQAKRERIIANEKRKKEEDDKFAEYQVQRNQEVETKLEELRSLQEQFNEEKEKLLAEKQENEDQIKAEEEELIAGRAKEIEDMQAERTESIKPLLEEVDAESSKLKELVDEKLDLAEEVENLEVLNKSHHEKVKILEDGLEVVNQDIERYTAELEALTKEESELEKNVSDLDTSTEKELRDVDKSHKELQQKIDELNEEKESKLKEKSSKKAEIQSGLKKSVKHEHEINSHLPEHLKKDVDEHKILDTGSLFSVEDKPTGKEVDNVVAKEAHETRPANPAHSQPDAKKTTPTASPKKHRGLKRLSKYFSGHHSDQTSPTKPEKKPVSTTNPATAVPKHASKSSAEKNEAESLGQFSISKDANHNHGGIFKEEI